MIHVRVTELSKARARGPGTLTLTHLQQALADAKVNVRGNDALNLGALASVRVFLVSIAVVWRDAPGVTRSGARLVLHGWLRAREHVLPQKVTFRIGLIKLVEELKGCGGGECGSKAGQGFIRACIILSHDH